MEKQRKNPQLMTDVKKVKYGKKIFLYSILAALVIFLGYSIISSFVDKDHIYANCVATDESIPTGDYQRYLKRLNEIGISSTDIRKYSLDEEPYKTRLASLTNTNLESNIVIDGNSGELNNENIDQHAEKNWPSSSDDVNKYAQYLNGDTGYKTSESGRIDYTFTAPKTGLYYIKVYYFIPSGKGSNVERSILINGETLFTDLLSISFSRIYKDTEDTERGNNFFRQDINGNDIKPSQTEIFEYRSTYIRDNSGYVNKPFMIYFKEGVNTISFVGVRDTIVITKLEVCNVNSYKVSSYSEYYESMVAKTNKTKDSVKNTLVKYETEDPSIRTSSSQTLYPVSDRTSANNYPSHPVKTKYNAIGGSKWTTCGDSISWDINVNEDGFYKLAFRTKQNLSRGMFCTRVLYIDDEVPFDEAYNCRFFYSSDYNITTIGSENEPYYIYLTKGTHKITLQASLGGYADAISEVQQVMDDLNDLYLKIIGLCGTNPDDYTNYHLYGDNARITPDDLGRNMQEIFSDSAVTLYNVSQYITKLNGEKSSLNNSLDILVNQIGGNIEVDGKIKDFGGFATNPKNVTKNLSTFKSNLSNLGTWVSNVKEQSLTIESFYLLSEDQTKALPRANETFFVGAWFNIRSFFLSFFFDYESIGVTTKEGFEREIEVWFLTGTESGREQANVVKSLIDQYFIYNTEKYKDYECNVILKVLAPAVLLPATLAGTGPDVAINVDSTIPVNYALRDAIYNLKLQPDFDQVVSERFTSEEMVPFEYDGGYYALPNTVNYYVMFYRTDIFEKYGLPVPETWEDVIKLLPDLQVYNLSFYLPFEGAGSQMFATLLYQRGGKFYTPKHTACDFSTEVAKQTFEQWCSFFNDYSFDKAANFSNRFRSGEMPIGISNFSLFNTLAVFAPEIAGKWDFAEIPGYRDSEGNLNRTSAMTETGVIILNSSKDYDASWAFLKFWTSTEIQILFANEIESILGQGARYNTANRYAMESMTWSKKELDVLLNAFDKATGIPEVPGSYYINRNLENAIREVINNDSNARETLAEYVELINDEITRKRTEFGLELTE